MDGSNVEPGSGLRDGVAGLHELLRPTDGGAARSNAHGKVRRDHAENWPPRGLDRTCQFRRIFPLGAAEMAHATPHICEFDVGSVPRFGARALYFPRVAGHGKGSLALISDFDKARRTDARSSARQFIRYSPDGADPSRILAQA